ncbi:MAG: hypothetical protein H8E24_01400, partial [Verrucomicrobia bacterium]|nr:hypothetical protein [Verrucomicrobiota bacterium]
FVLFLRYVVRWPLALAVPPRFVLDFLAFWHLHDKLLTDGCPVAVAD